MKMRLAAGRDFSDADRPAGPLVAIVNETAARRWWPNQEAVGRSIRQQRFREGTPPGEMETLTVVGVARDTKYRSLGEAPRLFVYVPFAQQYRSRMTIVARSSDGQRLAVLSASLGLVGLLLAAIGIYGVTAYVVTSRTREIGIRIALGAQQRTVRRMVLKQGMTLTLAGAAIGLTLAAAAARLLSSMLFGVDAADPIAFGGAAILFCSVGALACYGPARRASGVDPIEALRQL
jgi:putative ABC transport system permease protein